MTLVASLIFLVLLLLAMPVGHGLVAAAGLGILLEGRFPIAAAAQRLFQPTQSFPLLAIPFFILAGTLMMSGRLGTHLIGLAARLVGGFRGGLAQVSIAGSVGFGGVSGSSVADASALGSALIPWQKREGYPAGFAGAVNAASSTISVLLPPSIPLIIFSTVASASIAQLFVAGIVPGLLLALGMTAAAWWQARRLTLPLWRDPAPEPLGPLLLRATPALVMPVMVVVALRFGIATPTEVSVLAVAYALLVSALVYRDLTFAGVWKACVAAGTTTGAVMLIIMGSSLIQWLMSVERLPQALADWATASFAFDGLLILVLLLIMLAVGTFLDLPVAILLLGPIFVPIAASIGMDPIHLGVVMVLALGMGLYTPPVGTTLFISSALSGASIGQTVRALLPFYLVALLILLLVTYLPFYLG